MTSREHAVVMAQYLLGKPPSEAHIKLYELALKHESGTLEASYETTLQHSWLFPYIDAYDALFRPNSQLRRRLYLLFSILEASPDFAASFLPVRYSPWRLFMLAGTGVRAVLRLVAGILIVKVIGL